MLITISNSLLEIIYNEYNSYKKIFLAVSDKVVGIIYWIATCKNICKIKDTK